jgi:tetratricopeptide (TPR) repeat protein
VIEYQVGLGMTYNNLGIFYQDSHRLEEAERVERQALDLRRHLVRDHPLVNEFAIHLGGTQCNLGHIMANRDQAEAALECYAEAITTLETALAKEPQHITAQEFLRNAHIGRVNTLTALGRHAEALPHRDRLVQLAGQHNGWPRLWRALTLARMKEHARATAEADALATPRELSPDVLYPLSAVYAISAAAVATDAKLTEQYAARGVNLLGRAVAKGFKDADKLQKDPDLEALRARPDFKVLLRNFLNNASWAVVARPGADAAAYRQALLQAETACQLTPDNGTALNTLGVAQYRLERYQEAADTLTHSDHLNAAGNSSSLPPDLAFLAMAHGRLGQTEKAQGYLNRLRETMKEARWAKDEEAQGFLREAETLMQLLSFQPGGM